MFVALYALQKYCNLTHHDMHLENILLHFIEEEAEEGPFEDEDARYLGEATLAKIAAMVDEEADEQMTKDLETTDTDQEE